MPSDISVLHLITKLAVGGAGMNTLISCRDLNSNGFRSEIATGPEQPSEGNYFHLADAFGIKATVVPHLVWRISPLNDLLALFELVRIMNSGDFDIVHTHGSKARILGRLAARLCRYSPEVVQTFHGWPFDQDMSLPVQLALSSMEKPGFRLARASVAVTPEDIFKGVSWGIGKPHDYSLIRSGVELARFKAFRGKSAEARRKLGLPPDCPLVGSVIRLAPVKNPELLLRVAGSVVKRIANCRFVIIGDGPMRAEVERIVETRGLSSSVLLAGHREDVEELLPAFDVFLITSRSEGMPRVMLEALSAGVPVVSTDVGGVCELLTGERNGLHCPAGDEEALCASVVKLLLDPELKNRLLEHTDTDLQPFSAEKMVEDLRDLYKWLAETTGR